MYELKVLGTSCRMLCLGLPLKALIFGKLSCCLTCRANSRQVCLGVQDLTRRLSDRWSALFRTRLFLRATCVEGLRISLLLLET